MVGRGLILLDDGIAFDAEYAGHFSRPHGCERVVALGINDTKEHGSAVLDDDVDRTGIATRAIARADVKDGLRVQLES